MLDSSEGTSSHGGKSLQHDPLNSHLFSIFEEEGEERERDSVWDGDMLIENHGVNGHSSRRGSRSKENSFSEETEGGADERK